MCGILGIYNLNRSPISSTNLKLMAEKMAHGNLTQRITGAYQGRLEDLKSALNSSSTECLFSSQLTSKSTKDTLNFSLIAPKSETKTVHPYFLARIAVPIPLSPAPKITICPD